MDDEITGAVEVTRQRGIIKARHPSGQIGILDDGRQNLFKAFQIISTYRFYKDSQLLEKLPRENIISHAGALSCGRRTGSYPRLVFQKA